jgi:hypothetical protein
MEGMSSSGGLEIGISCFTGPHLGTGGQKHTHTPDAEPNNIFESDFNLCTGDHYVRVSWLGSKELRRTKTVLQTSKPFFDSKEMVFDVPHFGMEYKLEVVDVNTDKPIGSCLLSAQGMLQWQ